MPSIKFSPDNAVAYKLHKLALAEGRSIADVVRRIVDKELATAAVATPAVDKHDNGQKVVVGAYLSGTLAHAIETLAAETDRSVSYVMRDLIRSELRNRGILPSPTSTPTAA